MASVDVKEIISKQGIDSVNKTTEALEKSYLALQDNIVGYKALNDVIARSKGMTDMSKNIDNSAIAQEKLKQAVIATQLQEERLAKFRANEAVREEARQKKIMSNSGYNPYKNLSNDYDDASKKAQNLGAQLIVLKSRLGDKPSVIQQLTISALAKSYDDATKKAKAMQTQLLDIDSRIGKFGRNVGNYKSGWNGLGNSINQISRELPAFTYSIQTGFMALSNNIPILFDEIKKTKLEIAALRAEGKQVPGLFKQIMSSVFSWGTALSIGITLLTVFGKEIGEFVKTIFAGTKAMDYFTERQKAFHEVRRNGFKDAQTELVNMQNLKRAAENTSLAYNERIKAVNELQKQYPKTLGNLKDEDILAGKAGDAYKYLTQQILATAYASAASSKIAENRLRSFDNEEKRVKARIEYMKEEVNIAKIRAKYLEPASGAAGIGSSTGQGIADMETRAIKRREAAGKIIRETNLDDEELNKRNLKLIKDIDDATKKYGVTVLGVEEDKNSSKNTDSIDLLIQRAKNRQKELKDITENEKLKLQVRLDAVKEYENATNDVAKYTAQKELSEADLTKDKIKAINEQKKFDIEQSAKEASDMQVSIQEYANKQLTSLLKQGISEVSEAEKARIQVLLDGQNSRMELIEKDRAESTEAVQELYDTGKIKRKQYEAEIFAIEKQASIDRIQIEIETLQKIIDIKKLDLQFGIGTQKELSDAEKALSDYRIALSKAESAAKGGIRKRDFEEEKERFEKIKELGQEVFNFGRGLVDGLFNRRLEALQIESDALEKNKNVQIENVNESVMSAQQKADQIAIINSQAEQKQAEIDARVREEKRKQAIADKAFAISQAIINGALAMTKVAAQTGILTFAFSPLIAALTAVQVAAIVAQPIPKFAKGGTMQKDGLAEYGHGVELRLDPDGKTSLTKDTPEIGFVKKGTRFISAPETKRLMGKPDKYNVAGKSWDISGLIAESQLTRKEFKKAINSISVKSTIITEKGFSSQSAKMSRINDYVNRNFKR